MFRFMFFAGILYMVCDYISWAFIGAGMLIGFWWLLMRAFLDPQPRPSYTFRPVIDRYPDMTRDWNLRVNRYLESNYMDGWELDDFPAIWAVKDD